MNYFIILLLIVGTFPVNAFPQSSNAISLTECLTRARQFSYRLQAEAKRSEAADRMFKQARSSNLPQVSADLGYAQYTLQPYNFRQQWSAVNVDWQVADLLLKSHRAAENEALAVRVKQEQTRNEVIRRVTLLYAATLQKQIQLEMLQKRQELLRAHLEVTRALWRAGARTQLDVLQTDSEISRLKEMIIKVKSEQDNLKQELARLINWSDNRNLALKPLPLANIAEKKIAPLSPELLDKHPLVKVLDYQIRAQQFRLRGVRASQLPQFHINSGYIADGDPTGDGNYWQLSAGINLPLFRWGVTRYKRQQIYADKQTLHLQKKELKRELTIQASWIVNKLNSLKEILSQQQQRLVIMQQAFQIAESNYQAGLITNLEYLTVQQKLTENKIAIEETRLAMMVNLVNYFSLTNQPDKILALQDG